VRHLGKLRRGRGFTLIEVLVALAIVAIGMAAVLSTITSSARTVLYMRDKTLANWVALNHIAEQRLQPQMPQLGNTDGDVDYAGQKWHWRQETVATAVKGMVRMDVMTRPADAKGDDQKGWYVTLSGIMGDAVAQPRGDMPLWNPGPGTNCQPGQTGPGGTAVSSGAQVPPPRQGLQNQQGSSGQEGGATTGGQPCRPDQTTPGMQGGGTNGGAGETPPVNPSRRSR
jgi:general secretion pathway protein I